MPKPQEALTLVVANFNSRAFVTRALNSILEQSHMPDRVVLVDDHSTDGSDLLLRQFAERSGGWARFVRTERHFGAPAGTFNTGIQQVETPLWALMSGDDYLGPECLEGLLRRRSEGFDTVVANVRLVNENGSNLGPHFFFIPEDDRAAECALAYDVWTARLLLSSRELFDRMGGCDESLACHVDHDLLVRLVLGGSIAYAGNAIYYHRKVSAGVTRTKDRDPGRWLQAFRRVYENHYGLEILTSRLGPEIAERVRRCYYERVVRDLDGPSPAVEPLLDTKGPGISFCIASDGQNDDHLNMCIRTIRAQGIPNFEIIVAGCSGEERGVIYLEHGAATLDAGYGAALARARFDTVVLLGDRSLLGPDWYRTYRVEGDSLRSGPLRVRLSDGGGYCAGDPAGSSPAAAGVGGWLLCRSRRDGEEAMTEFRRAQRSGMDLAHPDPGLTLVGSGLHRRPGNRGPDWVRDVLGPRNENELIDIADQVLEAGRVAEAADCLRYGLERDPMSRTLSALWRDLEEALGGHVAERRWSSRGDPAFRAALEFAEASCGSWYWKRFRELTPRDMEREPCRTLQRGVQSTADQCSTISSRSSSKSILGSQPSS